LNIYDEALKAWGKEAQLGMVQEECAELIVAINKLRRGRSVNNVIEECVDVELCLEQMKNMFPEYIQVWNRMREEKLLRLYNLLHPQVSV
jgi:hypothetical protein